MGKNSKKVKKFKANNPKVFAEWYGANAPSYDDLCAGKAVELDEKNSMVRHWIDNKVIVEE
jgi:hypothetical protein